MRYFLPLKLKTHWDAMHANAQGVGIVLFAKQNYGRK